MSKVYDLVGQPSYITHTVESYISIRFKYNGCFTNLQGR